MQLSNRAKRYVEVGIIELLKKFGHIPDDIHFRMVEIYTSYTIIEQRATGNCKLCTYVPEWAIRGNYIHTEPLISFSCKEEGNDMMSVYLKYNHFKANEKTREALVGYVDLHGNSVTEPLRKVPTHLFCNRYQNLKD